MNLVKQIKNYHPFNEQEAAAQRVILDCFEIFPDLLTRENEVAHLTASAFTLNENKDKTLMVYHNIYDSWAWTGGHADGNDNLFQVARQELMEETGVKNIRALSREIYALDVLPVFAHCKNNNFVAGHLHLNLSYLLQAAEKDKLQIKPDENKGVKWIPLSEIRNYSTEKDMYPVYEKIISKFKLNGVT